MSVRRVHGWCLELPEGSFQEWGRFFRADRKREALTQRDLWGGGYSSPLGYGAGSQFLQAVEGGQSLAGNSQLVPLSPWHLRHSDSFRSLTRLEEGRRAFFLYELESQYILGGKP